MKIRKQKLACILLLGFLVSLTGTKVSLAKDWVGVLICGVPADSLHWWDYPHILWNNGVGKEKGFDEFWNDTFLMWELLYDNCRYKNEDIHVLYADGNDFETSAQRYQAELHGLVSITDNSCFYHDITDIFTSLADGDSMQGIEAMTDDDFLFWVLTRMCGSI